MKKNSAFLIVIGLLLLAAFLTNPNEDRHKETVKTKLNIYMQESFSEGLSDSENGWEQLGQVFGQVLGGVLIDGIVSEMVTSDNYYIFSTTQVNYDGKSETIGVGAFGNVYLTKKMDEFLKEGMLRE